MNHSDLLSDQGHGPPPLMPVNTDGSEMKFNDKLDYLGRGGGS